MRQAPAVVRAERDGGVVALVLRDHDQEARFHADRVPTREKHERRVVGVLPAFERLFVHSGADDGAGCEALAGLDARVGAVPVGAQAALGVGRAPRVFGHGAAAEPAVRDEA